MALYLNFTARAPSGSGVSIDYPYLSISVKAYTTPDFQPATQVQFTFTAASFSTDVSLTGLTYTAYGTIPDSTYYNTGTAKQNIDGSLDYNTEYYFQATVTGYHPSYGTSEPTTSDVYTFTTESSPLPSKPINPTPEHEGTGVTLHSTTVSWEDGGGAISYNLYYGTLSGFLSLVAEGISELEAILIEGNFDHYGEIYYWRVDAVNDVGVTQGDEWAFTTLIFDPVLPTGVTLDEDGEPTGTPTGESNMVTIKRLIAAANNKIWYEDI